MYKGIQQFYLHEIKKEKKRAERRQKRHQRIEANKDQKLDGKKEIVGMTAKDTSLIHLIRCDPNWPTCFFDFTQGSGFNDFFVYKVGRPRNL